MTVFSFNYQLYPPGETEKYRPMIKVGLCYKESTAGFQALIDSGSDITISFVEVGNALGIDFSDARLAAEIEGVGMKFLDRVEGLTGGCEAYTAPAKVFFNGREEMVVIKWLNQKLDPKNDFPIILGQDSIFSFYDIHFSRRQKKFFLNTEILSK